MPTNGIFLPGKERCGEYADLHHGDRVRHNGKIYLVVSKTLDVQGGFYEMMLHESSED